MIRHDKTRREGVYRTRRRERALNDHEAVAFQLGREPLLPFRVVARCPAGHPSVIENERRREMPTTFWITCPTLQAAISRIEAAGGVRQAQEEVGPEAGGETQSADPGRFRSPGSGVGDSRRIKCLHAFTP